MEELSMTQTPSGDGREEEHGLPELDGTVGHQLEHDHHRIDQEFARFAQSLGEPTVDRAAFDGAAAALRHHIYVEETLHFPIVQASGLLAPIMVMLREHGQIWDLLDTIATALDHDDASTAQKVWPQLATVLEQHNAKEEQIVYPVGGQKISTADAELIVTTLAAGDSPPGWVCDMAGRTN